MLSIPFFFFNDTATTEIYTLSLHDALPISTTPFRYFGLRCCALDLHWEHGLKRDSPSPILSGDRKSTRLNSSHSQISYAVFCLKKKINPDNNQIPHHCCHGDCTHDHNYLYL